MNPTARAAAIPTEPLCLHCRQAPAPRTPTAMPGFCQGCTDRWEDIATLGFQVSVTEARRILAGTLPARVREELTAMVKFFEES